MVFSREQRWRKIQGIDTSSRDMVPFIKNEMKNTLCELEGDSNSTVLMQMPYSKVRLKETNNVIKKTRKKSVRFALITTAILIPSRTVYYEQNLMDSLWWSGADYTSFRISAKADLQKLRGKIQQPTNNVRIII
mmetsp:Transcript_26609/g.26853  ORF Transcript_26609/g.26853 Transcript_26609/m.26853 type:complete len:134 (+) Transcript_26609:145-546(+)